MTMMYCCKNFYNCPYWRENCFGDCDAYDRDCTDCRHMVIKANKKLCDITGLPANNICIDYWWKGWDADE